MSSLTPHFSLLTPQPLHCNILIDQNKRMMERSRPSNNKPSLKAIIENQSKIISICETSRSSFLHFTWALLSQWSHHITSHHIPHFHDNHQSHQPSTRFPISSTEKVFLNQRRHEQAFSAFCKSSRADTWWRMYYGYITRKWLTPRYMDYLGCSSRPITQVLDTRKGISLSYSFLCSLIDLSGSIFQIM